MSASVDPQSQAMHISGTWNARDVGGRAIPQGSTAPLATGVVFRTASLAGLDDQGEAELTALGVSTVCDLRSDAEVERDGVDKVPGSVAVHRRAMEPSDAQDPGSADISHMVLRLMQAKDPQGEARAMMRRIYRSFVLDEGIRWQVGLVMTDIAQSAGASVIHCSAGKDRTGWVVALVQYLCGVDDDERVAEYVASASAAGILAGKIPPIPGLDAGALAPLLTVHREYLEDAWDLACQRFGSIDGYLGACDLSDDVRVGLAARLVR